ncbi:hypothetical protein GUITHDRAFT_122738 [Guillardia theta CCMP2712]|uniref:Uncharacterized protein n=1 Tax=Guillardia theta (strain CCMP2712) TaxID=905079 RepID=L1I488_GUITC|nr:hypothetical protein GUITHDRAFT_122738 [Guillardia theta CCMP2712]EKX31056.1 hypothetical protein GUITHDRAFT_122738 [Guillardia theta CCMP2712]|eukprot:XP_005818036.1 hypothetical protein GUITHDRAFT_122738 [Guillardia theta CCMP2712]
MQLRQRMGDGGCASLAMHERDEEAFWSQGQGVWSGVLESVKSLQVTMDAEEVSLTGAEEIKQSLEELTSQLQTLKGIVDKMTRSKSSSSRLKQRCSNLTTTAINSTRRRRTPAGARSLLAARAHAWDPDQLAMTRKQRACDKVMGLGIVNSYLESMSTWCKYEGTSSSRPSLMRCYRLKYPWKMDSLFCEGFNMTIDFSK